MPGSDDVKAATPRLKLTYDDFVLFPDPELDLVRVYRRGETGFNRLIELSAEAGDRLATEQLPGLEIALARLFEPSVR